MNAHLKGVLDNLNTHGVAQTGLALIGAGLGILFRPESLVQLSAAIGVHLNPTYATAASVLLGGILAYFGRPKNIPKG